jgi:hypothetical protein
MKTSTKLILIGIVLFFVPFPPFATIASGLCIGAGVLMKIFSDK